MSGEKFGRSWRGLPVPPAYGPTIVNNWGDGEASSRAVLRVAFALTREELVYALWYRFVEHEGPTAVDPASLGDAEVRELVESWFETDSAMELHRAALALRDDPAVTEQERATLDALGAVVDRVYPPARLPAVLDGTGPATQARCTATGCSWSAAGRVEPAMYAAIQHNEKAHGGAR